MRETDLTLEHGDRFNEEEDGCALALTLLLCGVLATRPTCTSLTAKAFTSRTYSVLAPRPLVLLLRPKLSRVGYAACSPRGLIVRFSYGGPLTTVLTVQRSTKCTFHGKTQHLIRHSHTASYHTADGIINCVCATRLLGLRTRQCLMRQRFSNVVSTWHLSPARNTCRATSQSSWSSYGSFQLPTIVAESPSPRKHKRLITLPREGKYSNSCGHYIQKCAAIRKP